VLDVQRLALGSKSQGGVESGWDPQPSRIAGSESRPCFPCSDEVVDPKCWGESRIRVDRSVSRASPT